MDKKAEQIIMHPVADYVTQEVASLATGYTVRAIERKRESGVWREDEVWIKAPDGRVLISIKGYNKWAEKGSASR